MEEVEDVTDSGVVFGQEDGIPIWNGGTTAITVVVRGVFIAALSMVSNSEQQ